MLLIGFASLDLTDFLMVTLKPKVFSSLWFLGLLVGNDFSEFFLIQKVINRSDNIS
jgi:hypothetical protein